MASPAWRPRLRQGAGLLALASALSLGSWSWPVVGQITGPYLAPATPYSAGHRGIDIAAPVGTAVRAPDDGVISYAGWVADRPVVAIDHGDGVLSSFEPVESDLTVGASVARDDVIGTLVASPAGHCLVSCLHLGVRVDGEYSSPLLFLGGLPWSVLYPDPG